MKFKEVVTNLWCGLLLINLVCNLFLGDGAASLTVFALIGKDITHYLVPNFFWFHFVLATTLWLGRIHPIFKWSWLGININLLPLLKRYFGLIFIFLLMLNMPSITCWEENTFRVGITSWKMGVVNSVLFGFAHCVIGVPVGAGIALTILGLWLTRCYFIGGPIFIGKGLPLIHDGQMFSTMNHTAFNMVGCIIMLIFLFKTHLELEKRDRERKKE